MSKKILTLSLLVPCYLLGDINLGDINITEGMEAGIHFAEVDLAAGEQRQANSLFDLLKNESSVEVAGGGSSNAKRIYLRGAESSTLNITLDGATQGKNIFQHRGNEVGMNPDILKVVDVKTAPDASKAGALGGAVEMTTKDAQDFVENGKNQGGIVKVGYTTNAEAISGSLTAYTVFDEHYGLVASASGVDSENYTDGHGDEMYATAYEDRNYFLKFTMNDLDNHDLKISFNQNSNGGDMQWGKNGSDKGPTAESTDLEEIVSTTTNYTLQHNYRGSNLLNLETNLNYTTILVDRIDVNNEYENENIGIKLQNHMYINTESTKNKISLGLQVSDEDTTGVYSCSSKFTSDCLINEYAPTSLLSKAVFIQNTTTINNLDINYGVRFDDYELETGFGKASDSTFSPNFGLDYKLDAQSNIYANYGKASRMSGTIPFTWMTNVQKDTTYSSDLKAEKSTRYEAGYDYKHDKLFTQNDTIIFNANIFRSEIKDLIVSKAIDGNFGAGGRVLTDLYNFDYEYVSEGFEVKASYYLDNYFGTLSYTQFDTNTFDEKAAGIAKEPLAVRRVGGWDSKKLVFNTGAELFSGFVVDYTLTAVAGIDNADQVTRPGYTTHDISTSYQANGTSPWTFYAAVTNITDKFYAPHTTLEDSTGVYRGDVGRDFRFTVKYEF